ncbi:hypothetical protein [Labedaea rhizosphaerae]|nr:hypothetical protein [Labedaea rhizosphaerae]
MAVLATRVDPARGVERRSTWVDRAGDASAADSARSGGLAGVWVAEVGPS